MAQTPPAAAADPPLGREVWMACAGPFARLPSIGTQVYFFPRGHADQCRGAHLPDPPLDAAIPCIVSSVELRYHAVSGDPYAVISLQRDQGPAQPAAAPEHQERTATRYYVKQLTGTNERSPFPIPKACADSLFPPLVVVGNDDRASQDLPMADVHGKAYGFNHVLKNRSHALTAKWNEYYDDTKLKTGTDAVVLMQHAEGRLLIGSRRGGPSIDLGRQLVDNVRQATERAAGDEPFTVTYYPMQGWPFVVPRKEVDDADALDWQQGMDVRMAIKVDAHELKSSRDRAKTPAFFQGVIRVVNNDQYWCKLQVDWAGSSTPNRDDVNIWQVQLKERSSKRRKTSDASSSWAPRTLKLFGRVIR